MPPAFIGETNDVGIVYCGVQLQRLLDLLGVDLLAAGVDADRASAQERDGAVGRHRGVVTGNRPGSPCHLAERCRGLLRVLVVPDRDRTADCQHALFPRAGRHDAAVLGQDRRVLAQAEARRGRTTTAAGDRTGYTGALRGSQQVRQHRVAVLQECVLGGLAPHDSRAHHDLQRRQIPGTAGSPG